MSEPTLTDEQRANEPLILRTARHIAEKDPFRHIRLGHSSSMTVREFVAEVDEWVAAMLADERAAREAAEAKVRDLTAGIGVLMEDSIWARAETLRALVDDPALVAGSVWVRPESLRALVDDPDAALAEVRAEAAPVTRCWRSECRNACYYPAVCSERRAEAEGGEDHVCDTGHFDRTICPEPCGRMHSYCTTCGKRADSCAHEAEGAGG